MAQPNEEPTRAERRRKLNDGYSHIGHAGPCSPLPVHTDKRLQATPASGDARGQFSACPCDTGSCVSASRHHGRLAPPMGASRVIRQALQQRQGGSPCCDSLKPAATRQRPLRWRGEAARPPTKGAATLHTESEARARYRLSHGNVTAKVRQTTPAVSRSRTRRSADRAHHIRATPLNPATPPPPHHTTPNGRRSRGSSRRKRPPETSSPRARKHTALAYARHPHG